MAIFKLLIFLKIKVSKKSEAIPVYSEDGQRASNEFNAKIMLRGRYSGELELPPLELDESETFEIELNVGFQGEIGV
jgi:hypothetical protein